MSWTPAVDRVAFSLPPGSSCVGLSAFRGTFGIQARKTSVARRRVIVASATASKKVLIVNTKGGGHAVIGPHLADILLNEGHSVSVRQVGPESEKGPFARYSKLKELHSDRFSLTFGDPNDEGVPSGVYDAVYDNNAKSIEDVDSVIAAGKAGAEVFYVSSAGAYKYNPSLAPHIAGDAASGPTIDVESALRDNDVLSATFRPIYIIGPGSAKREYTDFFFHRIVRGRPILIPGTGAEFVSLSDVRDVAGMMAASLGKGLSKEIINAVSTRAVTAEGIARMCEKAVGKKAEIITYDASEMQRAIEGFKVKKAYPFRPRHFFADPFPTVRVAKSLAWSPKFSGSQNAIESAIAEEYGTFLSLGLDKADVDFSLDEDILLAMKQRSELITSK